MNRYWITEEELIHTGIRTVACQFVDCGCKPCSDCERNNESKFWESRKMQGWIDVNDRLPEKTYECLVYTSRGRTLKKEYTYLSEEDKGFDDLESIGSVAIGGMRRISEYATHWMPLPKQPTEDMK